jgi:hypothetical protein
MMEIQELDVVIGKDGAVQVHVSGVKGTSCLDLTKALERALGNQIEARKMTPEAQETPHVEEHTSDWLSTRT